MNKRELKENYREAKLGGYSGSFKQYQNFLQNKDEIDKILNRTNDSEITEKYFTKVLKKFVESLNRQKNIIRTIAKMLTESDNGRSQIMLLFDKLKRQERYDKGQKIFEHAGFSILHNWENASKDGKILALREMYRFCKENISYETEDWTNETIYEYLRFEKAFEMGQESGMQINEAEPWVNPDPELEDEFERAEREEREQDALDELTFNDDIEEVGEKNKGEII